MKIVFMGTPDFSVPALEALYKKGHKVELVITQPDTARDRGKKIKFTPVKERAINYGVDVLQPERVRENEELFSTLRDINPDVIVVVAYGQILPKEVLEIPKYGCINIHGSLLPRHRGAAPIQRAIIDGDEKTGITIMYMEEGLDTGDMLAKRETFIDDKNAEQLHDELSLMGADLLIETLDDLESGKVVPEKQDDNISTYAPMIFKKDGEIDFSLSPKEVVRKIKGLYPWPGAYTKYKDNTLKIWDAKVKSGTTENEIGEIVSATDEGLAIACGDGILLATTIQMPGKKRMLVKDFLKGNKIEKNHKLG